MTPTVILKASVLFLPASSNNNIGRPSPATSFAQTHDIIHSDLFVSCIRSFLRDLSLLINRQDQTIRIPEGRSGESTGNIGEGVMGHEQSLRIQHCREGERGSIGKLSDVIGIKAISEMWM